MARLYSPSRIRRCGLCLVASVCVGCSDERTMHEPATTTGLVDMTTLAEAPARRPGGDESTAGEASTGELPLGTPWVWELPEGFPPPYVPEDNPMTEEKVELGRHLFYDVRLSYNETQSCSSCHDQARGFAEGRATPVGSEGAPLARNAQGLANVGYMYPYTWANPKLETLEQQVLVPLLSQEPVELGMTGHEDEILERLRHEGVYARLFAEAFPRVEDPYTVHHVAQALASFLRALVSVDSPYDRYYAGDDDALTASAKRGIELFFSERLECYHCHGGFAQSQAIRHAKTARPPLAWHNIGLYNLDADGSYPFGNRGVYEITLDPRDMGAFRPPSLRNVAVTGPYMHDGSVASLDEVLRIYERSGRQIDSGAWAGDGALNPNKSGFVIGFEITDDERADVIAFFEALTDETFLNDPRFSSPFP